LKNRRGKSANHPRDTNRRHQPRKIAKRFREALQESEEKYRGLVEGSASFIGILQEGRLKYVNSTAIENLGWSREELLSPSFDVLKETITERDRPRVIASMGRRLRGEKIPPYEISIKRRDGREIPVLVQAVAVKYEGRPAIEFSFANITERKRVEEKLRESEERYRSLFDRMLDGVYLSTHEGRFVDVNPAFVRMFGYSSKEEMLEIKDIRKELYFSPEERGSHLLDTGQEEVEAYRMRRKDGSEIWVEDHGRYIHDANGKVLYHEGILRDVTERIRAEEALRDNEERYRTIFENSPLGIFRSTFQGQLIEVNPALARMFDYNSPEDMIYQIHDIAEQMYVHPEDRPRIVANQLTSSDITQYLNHYRRRDGSEFTANVYVKTGRDAEGRPIFLEGIVEDITERKQLEDRLSALHDHALKLGSAKEVREIIRHTLDAMQFTFGFTSAEFWLVDETRGRILREGERGMNSPIAEFRLDGPGVLVKAVNTGRTIKVADSRKEEAYVDDEGRVGKDASPVKLSELAVPVIIDNKVVAILDAEKIPLDAFTDEDQRLLETLSSHVALAMTKLTHEDELRRYSERLEEMVKERSKKLTDSEARYRRLFESSPVALFEEDFSEVKKYLDDLRGKTTCDLRRYFTEHPEDLAKCASLVNVVDVNETTLDMYGAKSVEQMRGELGRIFTTEFQERFKEELLALDEGKTRFASEFDNQTLNGDTRHVSLLLNVEPGYEDTLARVLVAIIDLTERKKMEQRLQQAERLAAIGETAAMVGHDLRNPLQGIAGALHLLKQDPLSADERREILQVIEKSLAYADSIVRDLSDYSAGIQLGLTDATPKSIVGEAMRAVKIPPNVEVRNSCEDRPTFRCDVARLRRVFVNLIDNAIDSMPEGGRLSISSRQVGETVEMVVSDTGSGMAEKVATNLWKPFQTTKAKGLGLGLSISKRIVDAHGGVISVESKAGEGTTITTRLPINPEAGR
jgi:PAS domain S-box-containing protein